MEAVWHDELFVRRRRFSKKGGIVRVGTPFPATAMPQRAYKNSRARRGLLQVPANKEETARVAIVTLACLLYRYRQIVYASS